MANEKPPFRTVSRLINRTAKHFAARMGESIGTPVPTVLDVSFDGEVITNRVIHSHKKVKKK